MPARQPPAKAPEAATPSWVLPDPLRLEQPRAYPPIPFRKQELVDLFVQASTQATDQKPYVAVNDRVYVDVGPNFSPLSHAGRPGWMAPALSHIRFAIKDASGKTVFTQDSTTGTLDFVPSKAGEYEVFAQLHQGSGIEHPIVPQRIRVYKDETDYRTSLLQQFAPVSLDDLRNSAKYAGWLKAELAAHFEPNQAKDIAASHETYLERFDDLRGALNGLKDPAQVRAMLFADGADVPVSLALWMGVDKSDPSTYVLVDLTPHFDNHVHRTFKASSPHLALQKLADANEYPQGVMQLALPDTLPKGQLADSVSIRTHGEPLAKRTGSSLMPSVPAALTLIGAGFGFKALVAREVIGGAAIVLGGGALSLAGLGICIVSGVAGILYFINDATTDVVSANAVAGDAVNSVASGLGAAALTKTLARAAGSLAEGTAGLPATAQAQAAAMAGAQGLLRAATAANIVAFGTNAVMIAPELANQIQVLLQAELPDVQKQEALHGLIASGATLGLLYVLRPKMDPGEIRAVLATWQKQGKNLWFDAKDFAYDMKDLAVRASGGTPKPRFPAIAGGQSDPLLAFKDLPGGPHKDQLKAVLSAFELSADETRLINERYSKEYRPKSGLSGTATATHRELFLRQQLISIQKQRLTARAERVKGMEVTTTEAMIRLLDECRPDFNASAKLLDTLFIDTKEHQELTGILHKFGPQIGKKLYQYIAAAGPDPLKQWGRKSAVRKKLFDLILAGNDGDEQVSRAVVADSYIMGIPDQAAKFREELLNAIGDLSGRVGGPMLGGNLAPEKLTYAELPRPERKKLEPQTRADTRGPAQPALDRPTRADVGKPLSEQDLKGIRFDALGKVLGRYFVVYKDDPTRQSLGEVERLYLDRGFVVLKGSNPYPLKDVNIYPSP
jgi:hypothetical protein